MDSFTRNSFRADPTTARLTRDAQALTFETVGGDVKQYTRAYIENAIRSCEAVQDYETQTRHAYWVEVLKQADKLGL